MKIICLKQVIASLAVLILAGVLILNWQQFSSHVVFFLVFMFSFLSSGFLILKVGLNTNPIIFTEEGVMQKWNKALLWDDIEGYLWMPVGKSYSLLRISPSNSMPIFWQIDKNR